MSTAVSACLLRLAQIVRPYIDPAIVAAIATRFAEVAL